MVVFRAKCFSAKGNGNLLFALEVQIHEDTRLAQFQAKCHVYVTSGLRLAMTRPEQRLK